MKEGNRRLGFPKVLHKNAKSLFIYKFPGTTYFTEAKSMKLYSYLHMSPGAPFLEAFH